MATAPRRFILIPRSFFFLFVFFSSEIFLSTGDGVQPTGRRVIVRPDIDEAVLGVCVSVCVCLLGCVCVLGCVNREGVAFLDRTDENSSQIQNLEGQQYRTSKTTR